MKQINVSQQKISSDKPMVSQNVSQAVSVMEYMREFVDYKEELRRRKFSGKK